MTRPADRSTSTPPEEPQFTLTRVVAARRELVWDLWTDPGELAHWFHPRGTHTPRDLISVDLRVGGRYRYTMVDDSSGQSTVAGGVYLELRRPERLSFTWGHPEEPPDSAPTVTLTLAEVGEQTELTLHVRGTAARPGDDTASTGWQQALDALADQLRTR
jgi:uncharacterized protein YndB with AHSA1/START domain